MFINVHVFGFVLFTLFALMHDPNLVNYALPPLLLYGLDKAFRCVMRLKKGSFTCVIRAGVCRAKLQTSPIC